MTNAATPERKQGRSKLVYDKTNRTIITITTGRQGVPMSERHPAVAALMQFFTYEHLPAHLQAVSKPFAELANVVADGPQNAETTAGLRKLLEAKDCAVRAVICK